MNTKKMKAFFLLAAMLPLGLAVQAEVTINEGATPTTTTGEEVADSREGDANYTAYQLTDGGKTYQIVKVTNTVAAATWTVPADTPVEMLVVGGGGAGGGSANNTNRGGGGGAGGLVWSNLSFSAETELTLTVGAGGQSQRENGSDTIVAIEDKDLIRALGGGGGAGNADNNSPAKSGGSGGGGSVANANLYPGGQSLQIGGYGSAGGNGVAGKHAGGGGGAGGRGGDGTSIDTNDGGPGLSFAITGESKFYAAGGGGGAGGVGGSEIGGAGFGGLGNSLPGTAGVENTGSGGGGGNDSTTWAGKGGSGIIVLRYQIGGGEEPVEPGEEVRILFLGNSITFHAYNQQLGWTTEWGMAASAEAKDYAHLVGNEYAAYLGKTPNLRIRNIVTEFERDQAYKSWSENSADHLEDLAFAPDVVILAIGENMSAGDEDVFREHAARLMRSFANLSKHPKIVIRGSFWARDYIDDQLKSVAAEIDADYVDTKDLYVPANLASQFQNAAVAQHPNDAGMRAIADHILEGLTNGVPHAVSAPTEGRGMIYDEALEYVIIPNGAWLMTDIIGNEKTHVEMKTKAFGKQDKWFGAWAAWNSRSLAMMNDYASAQDLYIGYGVKKTGTAKYLHPGVYTLDLNWNECCANDTVKSSFTASAFTTPCPLAIGGIAVSTTTVYQDANLPAEVHVFSFKVWTNETVLAHSYVPVMKDGVAQFYDEVTGTLAPSSTSVPFQPSWLSEPTTGSIPVDPPEEPEDPPSPSGKLKVSILGDSYSATPGTIPTRNEAYTSANVGSDVSKTYWGKFIAAIGGVLETNESWSGSLVSRKPVNNGTVPMIDDSRCKQLGNPDIILLFGGTNDAWNNADRGEGVDCYDSANWTADNLKMFRPAYAYLLSTLKTTYPKAQIICLINTTSASGAKPDIPVAIAQDIQDIADHYSCLWVQTAGVSKQSNHPDAVGNATIFKQLYTAYKFAEIAGETPTAEVTTGTAATSAGVEVASSRTNTAWGAHWVVNQGGTLYQVVAVTNQSVTAITEGGVATFAWTVPAEKKVEYLAVGGGAAGGGAGSAASVSGGSAGQFKTGFYLTTAESTLSAIVGAGGQASTSSLGASGEATVIRVGTATAVTCSGGTGKPISSNSLGGDGGDGAGGEGTAATAANGGSGGAAVISYITGSKQAYAGGGTGWYRSTGAYGTGGGADGIVVGGYLYKSDEIMNEHKNAVANTGSGGAGGTTVNSGNGADGIAVFRYPIGEGEDPSVDPDDPEEPSDDPTDPSAGTSGVVINEVMASNGDTLVSKSGYEGLDWIELYNGGDQPVDVKGWVLYDKPSDKPASWKTIQSKGETVIVPAHGYRIIYCEKLKNIPNFRTDEAYVEIGLSTDGEEALFLATDKAESAIVDRIDFPKQIKDVSYGIAAPARQLAAGTSGREGFEVAVYQASGLVRSMDAAKKMIANESLQASAPVYSDAATINFADSALKNAAVVIKGQVVIPTSGTWTFDAGSAAGFSCKVSGFGYVFGFEDDEAHEYRHKQGIFNFAQAGVYDVEFIGYVHTESAEFTLSAANGSYADYDDAAFKLVAGADSPIVHPEFDETKTEWSYPFTLDAATAAKDALLEIKAVGEIAATLNGTAVAVNTPIPAAVLNEGENTLVLARASAEGSFFFDFVLYSNGGVTTYRYFLEPTPGEVNAGESCGPFSPTVTISEPHGFKTAPISVTLECDDPEASIYYTLDSTVPSATNGTLYDGAPIEISATTILRAAAPVADSVLQTVATASYFYLDDIVQQDATAPTGFPTSGSGTSAATHKMAYGFNATVMGSTGAKVKEALVNSLPVISIVCPPEDLFGLSQGIYVNSWNDGRTWERLASVELFDPQGREAGFTIPAGLRIRGGASRAYDNPRHSFRLFFRSSYGAGKLSYPLFGEESPVEDFDKVDLRTSQNYSWAYDKLEQGNGAWNTYVHETFSRDSQRDQHDPYTRSRYYHLYLNGQYWGFYQTQERGDEDFGEAYVKDERGETGRAEDFDVLKSSREGTGSYETTAAAGDFEAWDQFFALLNGITADNGDEVYLRMMGRNADGTENLAYPVYLDDNNLMDYMLNTHYADDSDCPWQRNGTTANNLYALRDKTARRGFVFLRHDAEHSMGIRGKGFDWNTFNPAISRLDLCAIEPGHFTRANFNPAGLHRQLMNNSRQYRRKYIDLFQRELLRPTGVFTVAASRSRFKARMDEINDAVYCEAARWGYNKYFHATWEDACKYVTDEFIPERTAQMVSHHRAHGTTDGTGETWFPSINAPVPSQYDEVAPETTVTLDAEAGTTIYVTLDGSDPMNEDGTVGATAAAMTSVTFTGLSQVAKMRALKNGEWSALETVNGLKEMSEQDKLAAYLRIAEVYSVTTAEDGDGSGEFITVTNISQTETLVVSNVQVMALKDGDKESKSKCTFLVTGVQAFELAPGAAHRFTPVEFDGWTKITNGKVNLYLDYLDEQNNYVRFYRGYISTDWEGFEATDGFGAYFVATDFSARVTEKTQWRPSQAFAATLSLASSPAGEEAHGCALVATVADLDLLELPSATLAVTAYDSTGAAVVSVALPVTADGEYAFKVPRLVSGRPYTFKAILTVGESALSIGNAAGTERVLGRAHLNWIYQTSETFLADDVGGVWEALGENAYRFTATNTVGRAARATAAVVTPVLRFESVVPGVPEMPANCPVAVRVVEDAEGVARYALYAGTNGWVVSTAAVAVLNEPVELRITIDYTVQSVSFEVNTAAGYLPLFEPMMLGSVATDRIRGFGLQGKGGYSSVVADLYSRIRASSVFFLK